MACRLREEPKSVQECHSECPQQEERTAIEPLDEVTATPEKPENHIGETQLEPDHHETVEQPASGSKQTAGANRSASPPEKEMESNEKQIESNEKEMESNGAKTEEIDTGIVLEYDFMVPGIVEEKVDAVDTVVPEKTLNDSMDSRIKEKFLNSTEYESVNATDSSPSPANSTVLYDSDHANSSENANDDYAYEYDDIENYDEYEYDDYIPEDNHVSSTEASRPVGIVEDKINVEDFAIVEVVKVPRRRKNGRKNRKRKNRKGKKKKLVFHEGEEAISILNEILEESRLNTEKRQEILDVDAESIEPLYNWNVGQWSNVSDTNSTIENTISKNNIAI